MLKLLCETNLYILSELLVKKFGGSNKVIFIDGPTNSGKTSLAKKLEHYLVRNCCKVAIFEKDLFLSTRAKRVELIDKFEHGKIPISEYSKYGWDIKSYYEYLDVMLSWYRSDSGCNEKTFLISPVYNRETGNLDAEKEITICKGGYLLVEGTESVDAISRRYADVAIWLRVNPQEVLLERLLKRELEKPKAARMSRELLVKRYTTIDYVHAKYLERRFTKLNYNYVVDTPYLPEVKLYECC